MKTKKPILPLKRLDDVIKIQTAVAESFGYSREQLLEPGRDEPRITARQMAIVLCGEFIYLYERELKDVFNYADTHAIHHALHKFSNKIRNDLRAKQILAELKLWAAKEFPKAKGVAA